MKRSEHRIILYFCKFKKNSYDKDISYLRHVPRRFYRVESKYEVTFPEGRDFTYEEVLEMIPEYDVLCSMFDFPVNKELIDHPPN